MLKFFRRIRLKLLDERNFRKYLIYAIGEIILVVIGILIALQLNNWNLNKIEQGKEILHLENILTNLESDLKDEIIPCIIYTKNQIQAYDLLQTDFHVNNSITNDSIRRLFFQYLNQWDLVLNTVSFDNLKSTGMDILSNDSIKIKILTLYGNNYKYLKRLENENNKFHYEGVTTILLDNVNLADELNDIGRDFLKNDIPLNSRLKTEAYFMDNFLSQLRIVKSRIEELIKNIKDEISRLK